MNLLFKQFNYHKYYIYGKTDKQSSIGLSANDLSKAVWFYVFTLKKKAIK